MNRILLFLTVGLLLVGASPAPGQDSVKPLVPTDLRCEYAVDPMGIDIPNPRLFWIVESAKRGQRQTAYQILVASSTNLLARNTGNLWDTGKIESDQTTHIHYTGKTLASAQRVFWKVRVWGEDGAPSGWSRPATWTMGLLGPNDWQAKWICAPAATETLLLRKEFEVRPNLVRALAFVCGLGQYEMSLNGAKAGDDLLSPGWTDYNKTALYDTKDVTALLHEGRNAVGLILGNGMYNVVRRNRFVKFTGSFGPLRAICQLRLEYADGSTQILGTDASWRTLAGPTVYSSIYGGEDYDARLDPQGWDRPGFDDHSWPAAVLVVRPTGRLRGISYAAPPIRAMGVRRPIEVRPLTNGDVLFDLGQNTSYMPRLTVSGPAGSTVRLTPGEIINDDGTVNRGTMGGTGRGLSWWQYTKGSDDAETWFPKFCYIGCRYLQARLTPSEPGGKLPHIDSLEGVIVHSSAAPAGEFSCSNDLFNRIRMLVRWAQQANMVSILTDCPHREKLGWLEEYHLNGPAIRYEFDVSRIFSKGMNDMAEAQLQDGLVPNIAPEYTQFRGTFRAAAEWGSAFIIVPWQQYQFDGDIDLLRGHFDAMKRYFAYLESRATNDILSEGLGDWYDLGPRKPGAAQLTPPPVTATAFYCYDAWVLSRTAAVLGKPDEAKDYAARAERVRARYNREFYHADKGDYATGSQCSDALPLALDIVEPQHRDAVLAALVHDVQAHGYSMTTGDVGFGPLLRALARGGRSDVIYQMINQDDKPGYGYQLKKGATSLCESWDANNSSSHDHWMLGQVTEWFYRDLAGIDCDPAGPGFKKVIIRPQPAGDLTWVKASYNSLHGIIATNWKRDGDRFTLDITIPANTTATVYLPTSPGGEVTESGVTAVKSPGVRFLRRKDGRAVYAVESGHYSFASKF